jgi:hypothetical protein
MIRPNLTVQVHFAVVSACIITSTFLSLEQLPTPRALRIRGIHHFVPFRNRDSFARGLTQMSTNRLSAESRSKAPIIFGVSHNCKCERFLLWLPFQCSYVGFKLPKFACTGESFSLRTIREYPSKRKAVATKRAMASLSTGIFIHFRVGLTAMRTDDGLKRPSGVTLLKVACTATPLGTKTAPERHLNTRLSPHCPKIIPQLPMFLTSWFGIALVEPTY